MGNQQTKATLDMGWLVGFIEGEGCFQLRKQVYRKQKSTLRPIISASSADFALVERAGDIIADLGVGRFYSRVRPTSRKEQLEVKVVGLKRCKRLLDQIIPYMTDSRRRETAMTLLSFCDYRLSMPHGTPYGEVDFAYGQAMRNLNGYQLRQSFRDSTLGVFDYSTKVESAPA